jgi:hypothetical protein
MRNLNTDKNIATETTDRGVVWEGGQDYCSRLRGGRMGRKTNVLNEKKNIFYV